MVLLDSTKAEEDDTDIMTRASATTKSEKREGETLEFKAQWTDRALEDLAAFANHKGGSVLVGIADDGQVVGFAPSDKQLQQISNQVVDTLGIRPEIGIERRRGQPVLSIRVKSSVIPVSCRGRYLVRVGSVNREMNPEQIARRLMEKLGETWDGLASDVDIRAVDREAVREFVRLAKARLPRAKVSDPPIRILENLKLLRDGSLTKGGVLLFGRDPLHVCVSAQTHIGRFKADSIEDDRMAGGNLWQQLEAVMTAFKAYLQKRVVVKVTELSLEGMQNRQVWEYPLDALREAVINALIHRDYAAMGNVEVRVYEDSILIRSPGGLPKGMTIERLRDPRHPSQPRNPLLARAFFLAGFIEHWGAGTTKIIQLCREQDLPEPEFVDDSSSFTVTFRKGRGRGPRQQSVAQGLNKRQMKLLRHMQKTGNEISNTGYQALTGASRPTAARDLQALVRHGLLQRIGATGRATRYRLNVSQTPQNRLRDTHIRFSPAKGIILYLESDKTLSFHNSPISLKLKSID